MVSFEILLQDTKQVVIGRRQISTPSANRVYVIVFPESFQCLKCIVSPVQKTVSKIFGSDVIRLDLFGTSYPSFTQAESKLFTQNTQLSSSVSKNRSPNAFASQIIGNITLALSIRTIFSAVGATWRN
ncbi:MAG: hypothetical protein EZS28_028786 [Streblomastix strix]|uniref:Uncharacterized protein n=1 Tax=Streblomastix strix TaxID=222440 RepID=A0A5J4UYU2_9EUKA|nr:MAG: hypothetical protein EZS28_028786 [Streblomastix strix]